jgi:hypothetical protein
MPSGPWDKLPGAPVPFITWGFNEERPASFRVDESTKKPRLNGAEVRGNAPKHRDRQSLAESLSVRLV